MTPVDTLADLRAAWRAIAGTLRRDLTASARLAQDPVATLRGLGYELSPRAALALQSALP